MPSWSTQQLTEFVAAVSAARDEREAERRAIERAAEALDAEIASLVREEAVVTAVGYPQGQNADAELIAVAAGDAERLGIPGGQEGVALAAPLGHGDPGALVVARASEPFSAEEVNLLRGMARVLALTLRTFGLLAAERSLRQQSEVQAAENAELLESLRTRQRMLEKSAAIQRSISRRAPLQSVLDSIIEAAAELLNAEVVGLRMVDEDDPDGIVAVALLGVPAELAGEIHRGRVGEGAGGRAISEGRLVVMHDYASAEYTLRGFAEDGLQAAMAAPVHERGTVVGSLTVASYQPGRRFSSHEQDVLLAFAEHVSLALMDAKTVDAVMHQALHDSLTGLPNRALFLDRLEHSLVRAERLQTPVGVLFIDLDGFKNVNDSLGHATGDQLLVTVAERIRTCARAADTAARLGGDEFAILLEDLSDRNDAARLAERVMEVLRTPFAAQGREVIVSASIGIASAERPGEDLLGHADLAMYRAKRAGKGRYEFFEPDMRETAMRRLDLEGELRRATERDEILLHYQPIVDLSTGRVEAVEALVRWRHPTRGLLAPAVFLPLAEETGTIVAIGRQVLRLACEQVALWQSASPTEPPVGVSVNLSARQLQEPGLPGDVADALGEHNLAPQSLMLELTETALMDDRELAVERLHELKSLGVRLALDDFGTGYSSLRYLRDVPLDALKIAKEFVDGVAGDEAEATLARAILELGATFELSVIAEGIEEPEQLNALRRLGAELGQGFLFARPLAVEQVSGLLHKPIAAAVQATSAARLARAI